MPAGKFVIWVKKPKQKTWSELSHYDYDDAGQRKHRRPAMVQTVFSSVVGWQSRTHQFRHAEFSVRDVAAGSGKGVKGKVVNLAAEADAARQAEIMFNNLLRAERHKAEEAAARKAAKARGEKYVKAPKVQAKPKKAKAGGGAGRVGKVSDAALITILSEGNPCRETTNAFEIFACFTTGMTVAEFVKAGEKHAKWNMRGAVHYFMKKGYINVEEPK